MTLTEQVEKLQVVLPKLKNGDVKFASDLIHSFKKYKKLSPKQEPWIQKLIDRAEAPAPVVATVQVGSFAGVINLFMTAKQHLKYPKITLLCLGKPVILSLAGAASKAPGSVNVMGEGKYPDREWFGRVSPDGSWTPSMKTTPEMTAALMALLTKFSAQPARVAAEYGKLTGNCCFCQTKLEDPKSLAAGFGPTCAEHHNLKTEWKLAVAKKELVAGTVASDPSIEVETVEITSQTTPAQVLQQLPKVACFFCEEKVTDATILLGYTVCPKCAKQLQ